MLIWIALSQTNLTKNNIDYVHLKEPSKLFNLSQKDINKLKKNLGHHPFSKLLEKIVVLKTDAYMDILKIMNNNDIEIIPISSESYPYRLRNISNPPMILLRRGTLKDLNKNCIAIVGRRNCTHYAHQMAREISQKLSENYIIVSGLARGIDIEAHCGALDQNGKTIAVLAKSLLKIYPSEFEEVSKDIIENGALLSEKLVDDKYSQTSFESGRVSFVLRNRIISGISKAILIIETNTGGGTMRQIDYSISQNKPTFILKPKNEKDEKYFGYNLALKKGALSFENIDDIRDKLKNIKDNQKNELFKQNKITDYLQ